MSVLRNVPLCMEDRMLVASATGVATYARALRQAHERLSNDTYLLSDGGAADRTDPSQPSDWIRRSVRALAPWPRRAEPSARSFLHHDVFRLGHAFFTLHGRLMPVVVPARPGIMHWSYPVPLRLVGWRNLYTVHDAIPLVHPELTGIDSRRHERLLRQVARWADMIVTVSESSRRDILKAVGCADDQVVDCSQPVEVRSSGDPLPDLPEGLTREGYLLVCGSVDPRKNVERIIAAHTTSAIGLPLVFAGPSVPGAEELESRIRALPRLVRLPYQSRAMIITLISQARALLMPSLAEGFGLPVIEAMSLGTPVITSNLGALAETAETAAMLVDPQDVLAIAHAIRRVSTDTELRHRLVTEGFRRARCFSSDEFAQRLAALYYRVDTRDVR